MHAARGTARSKVTQTYRLRGVVGGVNKNRCCGALAPRRRGYASERRNASISTTGDVASGHDDERNPALRSKLHLSPPRPNAGARRTRSRRFVWASFQVESRGEAAVFGKIRQDALAERSGADSSGVRAR